MTGSYKGKRMTVLSTGIGIGNIDICVTELDALANVDFATRQEKAGKTAHAGAAGHFGRHSARHQGR